MVVPALALIGALALACFVKAFGTVFLGMARSPHVEHAHEVGRAMTGPMLVLAATCLAIGVLPLAVVPVMDYAVRDWLPQRIPATLAVSGLVPLGWVSAGAFSLLFLTGLVGLVLVRNMRRRSMVPVCTWDCGYARPTARMQYTAGSFAAVITEWFAFILRPQLRQHRPDGYFPNNASHSSHTPETVLEHAVEPAGRVVMRVSTIVRRLQHGRAQPYILYILLGLLALAAWVSVDGKL